MGTAPELGAGHAEIPGKITQVLHLRLGIPVPLKTLQLCLLGLNL